LKANFPIDAPKQKVVKAPELLGFRVVRENPDGSTLSPLIPNHPGIKASMLRIICSQAGISREEFFNAY